MKQTSRSLQVELPIDSGLVDQFPEFRDVIKASVYSCGRAFKSIAADMDMSVSELSRKLNDNPSDPVNFPLHRLPELMKATGDMRPIYWLVESFIEDPESKRKRAINELSKLMPMVAQLVKASQ